MSLSRTHTAAKYLKPYQGLKPVSRKSQILALLRAAKYLKPYQGLKRRPTRKLKFKHRAPPQNT